MRPGRWARLVLSGLVALLAGLVWDAPAGRAQSCSSQNESTLRTRALTGDDLAAIERYLSCFSYEDGASAVRRRRDMLVAAAACRAALGSSDPEVLETFIRNNAENDCAPQVATRLGELRARRQYREYPNAQLVGDQIGRWSIPTVAACAERCDRTPACVAYTFEPDVPACSHWSAVRGRMPRGAMTSWSLAELPLAAPSPPQPQPQQPAQPTRSPRGFLVSQGQELQGREWRSFGQVDGNQCEAHCAANVSCQGFNYYPAVRLCSLRSVVTGSIPSTSAFSGRRNSPTAPLDTRTFGGLLNNTDIDNGRGSPADYRVFMTTLAACAQQCQSDGACVAFSFLNAQNYCVLKSGIGRITPKTGVTSSMKLGPAQVPR
ncbi:PAN domain-containing protein [Xanthobacteraceae bacterium A53D]